MMTRLMFEAAMAVLLSGANDVAYLSFLMLGESRPAPGPNRVATRG